MKRPALLLLALLAAGPLAAQQTASGGESRREYPFILRDDPARLFTVRQIAQDYLSGYRLFAGLVDRTTKPVIGFIIEGLFDYGFFKTLTHEEAHRSILVGEDIGAVSHPFPFEKRTGYVMSTASPTRPCRTCGTRTSRPSSGSTRRASNRTTCWPRAKRR
jgi:hypothetical protein